MICFRGKRPTVERIGNNSLVITHGHLLTYRCLVCETGGSTGNRTPEPKPLVYSQLNVHRSLLPRWRAYQESNLATIIRSDWFAIQR